MKFIILSLVISLFFSVEAFAVKTVKAVNAYEHNGQFVTEVRFDQPVEESDIKINYINQTIQVELENTKLEKEKLTRSLKDDRFKSIYTFQPNENTVWSRIIQHKPYLAKDFDGQTQVRIKGNIAFISINKEPVEVVAQTSRLILAPNDISQSLPEKKQEKLTPSEILAEEMPALKLTKEMDSTLGDESKSKTVSKEKSRVAKKSEAKVQKIQSKESLPEDQIPVFSKTESSQPVEAGSVGRMLISLLVIGLVAVGITLFTKRWSRKHQKTLDNNKIRILTQHHLGPKKTLTLIQVAGETILLGVTDQNINMIKSLSLLDEDIPDLTTENFNSTLNASLATDIVLDKVSVKSNDQQVKSTTINEDEYSFSKIKDIVSTRLKDMRPL